MTLPNSAVVLPANRGQASLPRARQPLAVEQAPLSQLGSGTDPLAGAERGTTATLTDQWRSATTATPPPARWQAEARDTGPAVQLGEVTGALPSAPTPASAPPAPSTPVSGTGWSAGGPTVSYPALDPLPRRSPGTEAAAPAAPAAPATPPAYQPVSAAPSPAPVVAQPEQPAEAPIFREMEAVWFRSHGNDETTIFARPKFDEEPPPAAAQPVASASQPVAPASPPPRLPTRTPGAQASGLTTPPPYTPPAVPPAAPVPPSPPPAATDPDAWRTAADEGWSRASQAAEPTNAGTTRSGLPKRVPQAQLVPGGIEPKGGRSRARRTPDEVRGLLSAYHRGVQRGRTAGADLNSTSTKETNR
ncbi:hypothetical protein GA0070604_5601 [Micromonospora eburnea]|uniref:Uncharacterized protein n=1 Tax=Micromonospora eburnea TaxID=227316 RepID=A0A1C6VIQ1_9ACTN|nr:hypothetical protein GA0070604_5601 [Micromonospora eburnea]